MTNREFIMKLLQHSLDVQVYIGKGMGPAKRVEGAMSEHVNYVVVSP